MCFSNQITFVFLFKIQEGKKNIINFIKDSMLYFHFVQAVIT